jgi:hypothetical protein
MLDDPKKTSEKLKISSRNYQNMDVICLQD